MSVANIQAGLRTARSNGVISTAETNALIAEAQKDGVTSYEREALRSALKSYVSEFTAPARASLEKFLASGTTASKAVALQGAQAISDWAHANTKSALGARIDAALDAGSRVSVRQQDNGQYLISVPVQIKSNERINPEYFRAELAKLLQTPAFAKYRHLESDIRFVSAPVPA